MKILGYFYNKLYKLNFKPSVLKFLLFDMKLFFRSEQDIEDFLSSLYGHGGGGQSGGDQNGSRFRKKSKRKK